MGIFKKPAAQASTNEMDVRTESNNDLLVIVRCICPLAVAEEIVSRGIARTRSHAKKTVIVRTDLMNTLAEEVVAHVWRLSTERQRVQQDRLFQLEEPHVDTDSSGAFSGLFVFTSTLLR